MGIFQTIWGWGQRMARIRVDKEFYIPILADVTTPPTDVTAAAIGYFNDTQYYWNVALALWVQLNSVDEVSTDNVFIPVPTEKFKRKGNRLTGLYNPYDGNTYSYQKVTIGPDGLAMADTWVDGMYFTKYTPTGEYFECNIPNRLSVKFFGAIGNAYYVNTTTHVMYSNAALSVPAADDTVAFQKAINAAVWTKKDLVLEQKHYQITDTLNIPGPPSASSTIRSLNMMGQGTGGFTYLRFNNATTDKNMLTMGSGMTYNVFGNIAFRDEIAYTSKLMTLTSTTVSPALAPLWKLRFDNFRVETFNVGLHFMGSSNYLQDSLLDGCTFSHGKFRECRTSVIYENTQAVNHTYLNVDFENGSAADISQKFKMFHLKRGTCINHFGGSVIGAGPYVYIEALTSGHFQNTSQFNAYGVRAEQRGTVTPTDSVPSPIIYHAETSSITGSNTMKVNLDGFSVLSTYAGSSDSILAKLGGQIMLTANNVRTNRLYHVYAAITTNLAASQQLGNIEILNSTLVKYKRYVPSGTEYGSAGVSGTNQTEIPAIIENKVEGANVTAVGGYVQPNNNRVQIMPSGINTGILKYVSVKSDFAVGLGQGTTPVVFRYQLPQYARPIRLAIFKETSLAATPFVITLNLEIATVDYQVAVIDTTGFAGYAEAPLILPAGFNKLYADGTVWDGKLNIVKSGSTAAFPGEFLIYYI